MLQKNKTEGENLSVFSFRLILHSLPDIVAA